MKGKNQECKPAEELPTMIPISVREGGLYTCHCEGNGRSEAREPTID